MADVVCVLVTPCPHTVSSPMDSYLRPLSLIQSIP